MPRSILPSAGSLPALLRHTLTAFSVEAVIDVGANEGQFATFLRSMGYKGFIVFVEPAHQPFELLAEKARNDGDWLAYQLAAGTTEGFAELQLASMSELNSLQGMTEFGHQFFGGTTVRTGTERVQVVRLDQILAEVFERRNIQRALLKLDTQGWDLEAARGAEGLMDRIVAIQTEISFQALYEKMPTFEESWSYFRDRGFEILALSPISIDYRSMILAEMDCLMVRPRA